MKRRAFFGTVITGVIALYAAVSLWPFQFYGGGLMNGAELLPGGGVRFSTPGIALIEGSSAWVRSAMESNRLQLSLRIRSPVPEQIGPARILTFSLDPYERNLTLGQEGSDLIVRLRTAWTDVNGMIDGKPVARIPSLFITSDWIDLLIAVEPKRLRIAMGNKPIVDELLPLRPLETWDPSYRLALGNELTGNRPWIGEIDQVAVRAGHSDVKHDATSKLELPKTSLLTLKPPKFVPFYNLNPRDAFENTVLYVPLGILLAFFYVNWNKRGQRVATLGVLVCVMAVSVSMELLQFFVPLRAPSVDDVIFNTLGGRLGLLIAADLLPRRSLG